MLGRSLRGNKPLTEVSPMKEKGRHYEIVFHEDLI